MPKFSLSRSIYGNWVRRYCAGGIIMAVVFLLIALALNSSLQYSSPSYYREISSVAPFIAESGTSALISFFVAGAGVVASVLCFSYLKKMRSAVMVHALPARRETTILSVTAAGLTLLFSPILLGGAFFAIVHILHGVSAPGTVSHWIFFSFAVAFFFFSVSSFVGMLTGNSIAQFLFTGVFINIPVLVEFLIASCCNRFLFGFSYGEPMTVGWNPFFAIGEYLSQAQGDYLSETGGGSWTPLGLVAFGILFLALALALYRVRNLECAGDVIALRAVRPIFRFGMALVGAVFVGSIARYTLTSLSPMTVEVIFGSIGGALGYLIAEMLIRRSLRVLRTAWKGVLCFTAVYILLLAGLNYDITGYGSRRLKAEEVYAISVGEYNGVVDLALSRGKQGNGYGLEELNLEDVDGYLVRAYSGDASRMPEAMMHQILQRVPTVFTEGAGFDTAIQLQNMLVDNRRALQQESGRYYTVPVRVLMRDGTVFRRDYGFYLPEDELPLLRDLEVQMSTENAKACSLQELEDMKTFGRVMLYNVEDRSFNFTPTYLTAKEQEKLYAALEKDVMVRQQEMDYYYTPTLQNAPILQLEPRSRPDWKEPGNFYIYYSDKNALDCLQEMGLLTKSDINLFKMWYKESNS